MPDRQTLATQTAADLHALEEACDTALHSAASMIARLIDGRREIGLNVAVGHSVIEQLYAVQGGVTEARAASIRAHAECEKLRRLWRVEASAPTDKDPPPQQVAVLTRAA